MTLEQKYISQSSIEHRKKYAQFFTPEPIAEFMCRWVLDGKKKTNILEPAYGLGIFSRIIANKFDIPIEAFEIDNQIYEFSQSLLPDSVNLKNDDYLQSDWDNRFDAILCNPPYLKFHDYDNYKYIPMVNARLGTKLNGFTNIYTLFLLKSLSQLKVGGRLSYIVPSEFLNSDYGVEVKRFLLESNTLRHVIVVDFNQCTFEDALTTACILLCEKSTDRFDGIKFSLVNNVEDINYCLNNFIEISYNEIDPQVKWKSYYDKTNCSKYSGLVPFSTFAKVTRGIATGANEYFTFKHSKICDLNLPMKCMMPCICKAVDAKDTFFTDDDYQSLVIQNKTAYIFNANIALNDKNVIKYIRLGEELEINKRYLTKSRSPWYAIENRLPSPIWVSVFNRKGLRFIRNEAGIYNLTNFHCVYLNNIDIDVDILFSYLITDVAKEIFMDNSRQYGNGLIKFEPNDLNKGLVVDLTKLDNEECALIKAVYDLIKCTDNKAEGIKILNELFFNKFTTGFSNITTLRRKYRLLKKDSNGSSSVSETCFVSHKVKQLNLFTNVETHSDKDILAEAYVCDNITGYGKEV
ncbi:MAG: N-6 DNA methylase [Muribaculum sp.]|nr:N-6 DNA methylase [Muribaculum sp.]